MQILRRSKIAVTMEIYTEVPSAAPPRHAHEAWSVARQLVPLLYFSVGTAMKTASYKIATGR